MMVRKLIPLALAMAFAVEAQAFGINDVLSIGIQAGSKLIGVGIDAGIDKVQDAMRDPDAEAAKAREEELKLVEQFRKQVAEIESMPDLRPLDRERLILQLEKQYAMAARFQSFVEVADARQREERDKIFTTAGLLNVVGEAAMSAPSVTVARAEILSATGEIQAREAMARLQVEAGGKSMQTQALVGAAVTGLHAYQTRDRVAAGLAEARDAVLNGQGAEVATTMEQAKATAKPAPVADRFMLNAFSPDLGRRVFVEFVGSPSETMFLRRSLSERGHVLVDRAEEADVAYRIEGEYSIAATQSKEGLTRDVGSLLESPSQDITQSVRKNIGSLTAGLGRLLAGMAMIEMPNAPQADEALKQTVLLVAARQPAGGKETRAAVTQVAQEGSIAGAALSVAARDALYAKLGIVPEQKGASLAATRP